METSNSNRNRYGRPEIYQRPFRTHEAAEWMGISERQLLTFARAGLLGKKVGGVWLFSQKQLAQFAGVETDE